MIPASAYHLALAYERAAERETMPKKPTPLDKRYTVKDGKIVKAKSHAKFSRPAQYAAKTKRKWRAAK